MAEIINYEVPKEREETRVCVDMEIIEHIYCATLEELLGDDGLMDLIIGNGWYKQALCDSCGVKELIILHKGVEHKLYGPPEGRPLTYEQIYDQSQTKIIGADFRNL